MSTSTTPHDTDPLGERDVKEEGKEIRKTFKKDERPPAFKVQSHSSLYLLKGLTGQPTERNYSRFVPNFLMFYVIYMSLYSQLIGYRKLNTLANSFGELEGLYFLTILFYYRILSVMRYSNRLQVWAMDDLDYLERILPPSDILIPGPLVPLFRSLCVTASSIVDYKVSPYLPAFAATDDDGLLPGSIANFMPCVPGILRIIRHQVAGQNWNLNFRDGGSSQPPAVGGNITAYSFILHGLWRTPSLSGNRLDNWRTLPFHPIAPPPNVAIRNWSDYFAIQTNQPWLSEFRRSWNEFCQHSVGSVPMEKLALEDGEASLVRTILQNPTAAPTAVDSFPIMIDMEVSESGPIEGVALGDGWAFAVNCDYPTNLQVSGYQGPRDAGPYWNIPATFHAFALRPLYHLADWIQSYISPAVKG
eukprot:NODE_1463_length_1521_cov_33.772418_g1321_i0.p1 GENE.NODE_1463_length_1521_cov_33.772418_g1321_i0~~NODE_1463_length_1521_cov_33.772418_g1321_i0.p1  ORF type:complete len:417 (-),score=-21.50 NODE_1463_length_1521_cov_33.772418_g1321_i0:142-1392(-)